MGLLAVIMMACEWTSKNGFAKEATQLCKEAGIDTDDKDLVGLGKKLSIARQADDTWAMILDSQVGGLEAKVDDLTSNFVEISTE